MSTRPQPHPLPTLSGTQVSSTLRALAADFFRMDVARAGHPAHRAPVPDGKPLRRSLHVDSASDIWESNAEMCLGLWQLSARF